MEEIELRLLEFIRATYNMLGWPGVVVLMAIESASIPLPSEIIMPLSGWMLIRDKGLSATYVFLAGFYGALGCTIGSVISYWMGAWGGRPLLEKYGRYLLISRKELDAADQWFQKYGEAAVFIARLLPVIRTFISFPAGVARMRLGHFVVYSFVGSFIWCVPLAYGGYLLGDHWVQIRHVMRPFDIPIILVVTVAIAVYIFKRVQELRADADEPA
ncbi:MAG: associated Golgi protein-related protein [Dehalococcoidia bacterium]|nr:associated Golgi protein-related protein [Dehalococcoidia bacterium]